MLKEIMVVLFFEHDLNITKNAEGFFKGSIVRFYHEGGQDAFYNLLLWICKITKSTIYGYNVNKTVQS